MSEPVKYLPKGSIFRVELEVATPVVATEAMIREWIAFGVGARWDISATNMLQNHDIETWGARGCKITNTGDVGEETVGVREITRRRTRP